jgi:hypothetical protein
MKEINDLQDNTKINENKPKVSSSILLIGSSKYGGLR